MITSLCRMHGTAASVMESWIRMSLVLYSLLLLFALFMIRLQTLLISYNFMIHCDSHLCNNVGCLGNQDQEVDETLKSVTIT